MRLTVSEKHCLLNLLDYDILHYNTEVESCEASLNYLTEEKLIKNVKENLKYFNKVIKEEQKIIDKIKKSLVKTERR